VHDVQLSEGCQPAALFCCPSAGEARVIDPEGAPRPAPGARRPDARAVVAAMNAAALRAVDPARAVAAALQVDRARGALTVGDRTLPLNAFDRIFALGAGKAGAAMAAAAEAALGDLDAWRGGLALVKDPPPAPGPATIELAQAGHPLPDRRGIEGAQRIGALARAAGPDDLVIVLISGGGSALLADPQPPLTLDDLSALTDALLRAGATIGELNAVRKHLSALKGGRLAERAAPATVIALILSDVIGSPLDVIASGPTVPDPSTYADALAALDRYGLRTAAPAAVERLERGAAGDLPETPKPGDPLFERVITQVIGDNRLAARAAVEAARALGVDAALLSTFLEGEAREVGRAVAALAKGLRADEAPLRRPACLVLGGETTVTVRGGGQGGRNQELALGAALALDGWGPDVVVATLATDGGDGIGDAAGAIADGTTIARARARGLDPIAALAGNDSYHFWQALGDAVVTGPTGTNVNDLAYALAL
jgi:glycerate 2-kinase